LPLRVPKLMTYQRAITPRTVRWSDRLSRGTLWFTAISHTLMTDAADVGNWRVVYNGVRLELYDFQPYAGPDAPLVFLGRIEEIKGPHLAIEIARQAGRPLLIAGNIPAEHQGWFDRTVAPAIDGERVRYLGPVNDREKNALLGRAAALLMPVLWEEPFGIVMAEALACGTPVIGLARGAVAEVVDNGRTGFVCGSVDEMVAAVANLPTIDRAACRKTAELRFSDRVLVDSFEAIYREMLAAGRTRRAKLL